VCPTGAKYTPDWTWDAVVRSGRVELVTGVLVRRLEADAKSGRITGATGNTTDASGEAVTIACKEVVLAGGFVWTPHLLLLSRSSAYPTGLSNRSGLVGAYIAGHRNVAAQISLPMSLYPGINVQHSLLSRKFMRPPASRGGKYLRHDLRIWESSVGREPRQRDDAGQRLWGDALLTDWKSRAAGATARVRAYYDVLPARESAVTLDATAKNRFGDPMPRVQFADDAVSASLRGWQEEQLRTFFERMAKAGGGTVISRASSGNDLGQEHPAGGCRMGADPSTSVVDPSGRSHDHENLWIAGAPTHLSASCCNGTLTFAAMGLWTAAAIASSPSS
jgi:glucose dehydrogenase